MITLIGDVHGRFDNYLKIIQNEKQTIQLGDMGIGFRKEFPMNIPIEHRFIRGNHDDPSLCKTYHNFLGDYGITPEGIYFIGGAYSIDWSYRQSYEMSTGKKVWWFDEEIFQSEYDNIYLDYEQYKPEIVISHDCPRVVANELIGGNSDDKRKYQNRTCDILLTELFKIHQPKLWVFGHYHQTQTLYIEKTIFKCLRELETYALEI